MTVAVEDRHAPAILWAVRNGALVDADLVVQAATTGSPELTNEILKLYPQCAEFVLLGLAEGKHGDLLAPLLEKTTCSSYVGYTLRVVVARHGLLECARILEPKASWWLQSALAAVIESGNVAFVQWVVGDQAATLNRPMTNYAATSGSVPLLRWLHEQGTTLSPASTRSAAKGGHLDALRWLTTNGFSVVERDVLAAADGGHADVLAFLVDAGVLPTAEAVLRAAANGHLSSVQFMLKHVSDVDELEVAVHACRGPDDRILRWWVGDGRRWSPHECAVAACEYSNPRAAHFIHTASGEILPSFLYNAVCSANLDLVRYAIDQGLPVTWKELAFCVHRDLFAFVDILLDVNPSLTTQLRSLLDESPPSTTDTLSSTMREFCIRACERRTTA
jgi:hypothetical protein